MESPGCFLLSICNLRLLQEPLTNTDPTGLGSHLWLNGRQGRSRDSCHILPPPHQQQPLTHTPLEERVMQPPHRPQNPRAKPTISHQSRNHRPPLHPPIWAAEPLTTHQLPLEKPAPLQGSDQRCQYTSQVDSQRRPRICELQTSVPISHTWVHPAWGVWAVAQGQKGGILSARVGEGAVPLHPHTTEHGAGGEAASLGLWFAVLQHLINYGYSEQTDYSVSRLGHLLRHRKGRV